MRSKTGKSNLDIVRSYVKGERPFIQVGYTSDLEISSKREGEIWTDPNGKKWIKKNGIKKAINNISSKTIDSVKQKCKDCGMDINLLGNKHDRKFYNKTGRCYDCLIKFESHLRVQGLYEDYEKRKVLTNQLSVAKDVKVKLEESLTFLKKHDKISFPNSDGSLDEWSIEKKEGMMKEIKRDLKKLNKTIINIENNIRATKDVEKEVVHL